MSSWPSAFTVSSALNGCFMQERQRLLLIHHHNYEHIHKHESFPWKLQLTLNHSSLSSYLQTWSAGEGKKWAAVVPSSRQAAASLWHSHTEPGHSTGMLEGGCNWANHPGVSEGIMGSDKAASPVAGVLEGAAGWEGCCTLPSSHWAQDHITRQPNLPQRFTCQIHELVNQRFLCCYSSKRQFWKPISGHKASMPFPEIFIVPLLTENDNKRHAVESLRHLRL